MRGFLKYGMYLATPYLIGFIACIHPFNEIKCTQRGLLTKQNK